MKQRSTSRSISGIPALILVFIPALIGWLWIINALWSAVTP